MTRKLVSTAVLAAAACAAIALAGSAPAFAAETAQKIGVVSLDRVLHESAPAKAAADKLQKEFARRKAEIDKMSADFKAKAQDFQKNGPTLTQSQRINEQRDLAEAERALSRAQREFREERGQRENEEIQIVIARANQVIQDLARRENYDLIFQDAVYASPRADITDKVLKAMK
ncbi:OmpH family outer membrane protein [Mesosutterella sp. OilRF-GAM-744-9]|uniref:OmpH family outer membrane protein n=1 Tax=Mesosutterella porci TaxID=2915351 RepID=A0ABS9MQK7_9BURK|nr:OmpH family outer membrane protein [Mesosutterella sp. oilRF-744-WT-GAM-9]MCG5030912.1 OmpH family outer membrane protein [Mesosutterella sp. oilRF-744-WT-GAM-9]MCI6529524.1 OmpH family outer membrane protein [Mesosutterella sp.]